MLFVTIEFVCLLFVVYLLYHRVNLRLQNLLLLAASYFFYSWWDWRFLGLIIASTLVDYFCGLKIHHSEQQARRRIYLVISIVFNLGVLCLFKYYDFFVVNLREAAEMAGLQVGDLTFQLILPLGISFYTFQTMSYTIDIYRRELTPTRNILDFALFVSFFPQLVAGPIERAKALLPQLVRERTVSTRDIKQGLWLIAWGVAKKAFVADNLARIVDHTFQAQGGISGWDILIGVYAFAFQIYADFSGYSDIAIGVALLLGIRLRTNFRFPYFVTNPVEFWRHWHISLSSWLRDYLYIPLGGNRVRKLFHYRNLFITMLLGGLWHGANWTFVLWGAYQGTVLIIYQLCRPIATRLSFQRKSLKWFMECLLILFMFQVTCLGWLIFRSQSLGQLGEMLGTMMAGGLPSEETFNLALQVLFYCWPVVFLHAFQKRHDDLYVVFRWRPVARWAVLLLLFYLTVIWGDFGGAQFYYFQF